MYLGSVFREGGGMTNETDIRIVKARIAYTNLESLWQRCDISLAVYNRVYNAYSYVYILGGWVLSVSFSADGNKLAWTKHNSTIFVADASISATPIVTRLRTDFLPFVSCIWIGPSTFVAGGYDCCPMLFRYNDQSISFVHQLDTKSESRYGGKVTAMKKFQDIDRMATADNTSSRLPTIHQNCINEIRILKGDRSMASELSSVGRDGNLVLWNFPTLYEQIADLKIV
ncbi:unnamed protein product [Schistosoma margrebowiei]|uniref:Uncharacterized protein n=1 Tax=Schistosoma margrebowiei TaxID=48269 RepID=A0A183N4X3_9TREM|nr:unnamed protein product [Schistosoma margrebowiei]